MNIIKNNKQFAFNLSIFIKQIHILYTSFFSGFITFVLIGFSFFYIHAFVDVVHRIVI